MLEVKSKRTEHSKTYDIGDGQYKIETSSDPLHYKDLMGNWQNIDLNFKTVENKNYKYQVIDSGLKALFKESLTEDYPMRLSSERGYISFKPVSMRWKNENGDIEEVATAAFNGVEIKDNKIKYIDEFPGVDDEFVVDYNTVKDNLIIKEKLTKPNIDGEIIYLEFVDEVETTGKFVIDNKIVKDYAKTSNKIEVRNHRGQKDIIIPKLIIFEQNNRSEEIIGEYELINKDDNRWLLVSRVPYDWLFNSDRKYPIIVDPNTTIQTNVKDGGLAVIDSEQPDTNFKEISVNGELQPLNSLTISASKSSLIRFNNLPESITINKADLQLYPKSFFGRFDIVIKKILGEWNGEDVTYNNMPETSEEIGRIHTDELLKERTSIQEHGQSFVPTMSSNTTPEGEVISSGNTGENYAWNAFDGNPSTFWSIKSTTGFIGYKLSEKAIVKDYTLTNRNLESSSAGSGNDMSPKNWSFEGSDDGENWIVLDSRHSVTDWSLLAEKTFKTNNNTAYLYYRLNITDNNGSEYTQLSQIEFLGSNVVNLYPWWSKDITLIVQDWIANRGDNYGILLEGENVSSDLVISDTDIIPTMTSNTTPEGIVFASSYHDDDPKFAPWRVFNDNDITDKWVSSTPSNEHVGYEFPNKITIKGYSIMGPETLERAPKDWTFEGSDDGENWIELDNRTGQTAWATETRNTYKFNNDTEYKYYRLNITDNNGGVNIHIPELEFFSTEEKSHYIEFEVN